MVSKFQPIWKILCFSNCFFFPKFFGVKIPKMFELPPPRRSSEVFPHWFSLVLGIPDQFAAFWHQYSILSHGHAGNKVLAPKICDGYSTLGFQNTKGEEVSWRGGPPKKHSIQTPWKPQEVRYDWKTRGTRKLIGREKGGKNDLMCCRWCGNPRIGSWSLLGGGKRYLTCKHDPIYSYQKLILSKLTFNLTKS